METTNCNSGKTNEKQGGSDKPEKIVRKLYVDAGEISFKSDTKPRAAGRNTVRSYSMATWKRKGHLRVYKNGKTVYIKEQICHRKGLDGDGSRIPPKLIKVIRKGGTGQDGGSENKKREQVWHKIETAQGRRGNDVRRNVLHGTRQEDRRGRTLLFMLWQGQHETVAPVQDAERKRKFWWMQNHLLYGWTVCRLFLCGQDWF